ncbi:hypothetical protein GF360_00440 [candidate division WWE3 bacterium]|nr:hypothetical protein [candidate division WWE3 bacterium]
MNNTAQSTNTNEKPYQMEPNIEAALSYLPLVGIAILLMEKENKFVRFHAFQSIFFWIASFAIYSMFFSLRILLIGFFLTPLVNIAITITWLWLVWKAYNKSKPELPVIGKLAQERVDK